MPPWLFQGVIKKGEIVQQKALQESNKDFCLVARKSYKSKLQGFGLHKKSSQVLRLILEK